MTLQKISNKYNTDKSFNGIYGHNYSPFYDMILKDKKDKIENILEIGVATGNSLKMWKEYFENSKIYGWDILDLKHLNEDRIEIFIIDQGKKEQIDNFFINNNIKFDFVIDDGSHLLNDQIISLFNIFPHLNSGAIYIIEDMWYDYFDCFLKLRYKRDYLKNLDGGKIESMIGEDKLEYLLNNLICCQKNNVVFSSSEDKSDHQFYVFYKK